MVPLDEAPAFWAGAETDVERRAGGDGNEYTFAEFLNYHNGDRAAKRVPTAWAPKIMSRLFCPWRIAERPDEGFEAVAPRGCATLVRLLLAIITS